MSTNDITELRTHLFDTLRALKDKESPMDIDRAKAVCEVGQVIINTAKVEIEHARVTGANTGTQFLGAGALPAPTGAETGTGTKSVKAIGNGATVTTHRMRG